MVHWRVSPGVYRSASSDGWSSLPLVIAAHRQTPNHSTGFSLAELVFGKRVLRTPDILAVGWLQAEADHGCTFDWV